MNTNTSDCRIYYVWIKNIHRHTEKIIVEGTQKVAHEIAKNSLEALSEPPKIIKIDGTVLTQGEAAEIKRYLDDYLFRLTRTCKEHLYEIP